MNFSLRTKFMLLMIVVTVATLGTFGTIATRLVITDKSAYIFESGLALSRAIAGRANSDLQASVSLVGVLLKHYDPSNKVFLPSAERAMVDLDKVISLTTYQANERGTFRAIVRLEKGQTEPVKAPEPDESEATLLSEALEHGFALKIQNQATRSLKLGIRFGAQTDPDCVVALAVVQNVTLLDEFSLRGAYSNFLFSRKKGETLLAPADPGYDGLDLGQQIERMGSPEGTSKIREQSGETQLLSFAKVGLGDLYVLSTIPENRAFEVARLMFAKSVLLILGFAFASVIISVMSSRALTVALERLYEAAREIGQGKFRTEIGISGEDEVGTLANGFKRMATEIEKLLEATAEKARMESELRTARVVQDTLFPPPTSRLGAMDIAGYYQPASECSGDWWHYGEVGGKIFFWIADATGHGAPAALITSAAKSAVSILEKLPRLTPAEAMSYLNVAIYETSKGRVCMTAFVGCFDPSTGELTYCNASHEPAICLASSAETSETAYLMDNMNPRLGESAENEYFETTTRLHPGDTLVLFTDGLVDLRNQARQGFGDRRLNKLLRAAMTDDLEATRAKVIGGIEEFREGAPLNDDVTFVLCRFTGRAA